MQHEKDIFEFWLKQAELDPQLRSELESIREDEEAIGDRFYRELSFGTSGLRGIMGAGTNRMNVHVIDRATQGVAKYLLEQGPLPRVALAYDTRNNSKRFALRAAEVLAGNGVQVLLFDVPAPVPALSYAVRRLGLALGIMITASHNPKQYNGYKVYGPNGCQIAFDLPDAIYAKIKEQDYFEGILRRDLFDEEGEIRADVTEEICGYIPDDVLAEFVEKGVRYSLPGGGEEDLRIVYSPLHGVGGPFTLAALEQAGFRQILPVEEQMVQDGDFPTCDFPNPERPAALAMGVEACREWQGDIFIANDPDCDRIGITIPDGDDYWRPTGNQIGQLLTNYLCANQEDVSAKSLVRSIVTSPYVDTICEAYGVEVKTALTGFKYLGAIIDELAEGGESTDRFLLGFEEANGYLAAPHTRDKDGVSSAVLIAQMAAFYKQRGMTLKDALEEIYDEYGYSLEELYSYVFPGEAGAATMAEKMKTLRENPETVFPADLYQVTDYAPGIDGLPKADVLAFTGTAGSRAIIRPSGTEPKIKTYLFVQNPDRAIARARMDALQESITKFMGIDPENTQ